MSKPVVEFFFDYVSPYAYLGSLRIEEVVNRHDAKLIWQPMVLGFVFKALGHIPPMTRESNAKSEYLLRELPQLAAAYRIPYQPRTEFLFRSIPALRATLAVPEGTERAKAVHALYHGAWAQDLDLGQPEVMAELLDKAGLDGPQLVECTQKAEIKSALKQNTDEAIRRGVFGAPTVFLDGDRMLWGHDRLDMLDYLLGEAVTSTEVSGRASPQRCPAANN